jgi:RNA-binding protein YhbY
VTDAVLKAAEGLFEERSLVKIRIDLEDRAERRRAIQSIAETTGAEVVHKIGKTGLFYRATVQTEPE